MAETANKTEDDELLRRPLYAFDLPGEILSSLTIKSDQQTVQAEPFSDVNPHEDGSIGNGLSCALCGVRSASVLDQRSHARSDVHRFNMKRKIRHQPAVSEVEFERMVEGLSESISGSESSDSEEDEGPSDSVATLLRKQAIISSANEHSFEKRQVGPGKPPLIWMTSPLLPENTYLGVYRALFTGLEHDGDAVDSLRSRQIAPLSKVSQISTASPHVFLCMMGGGHFAAMIVSLTPKVQRKHGHVEREAVVLAHKTFHRYTTRRKQGGSQSANDNAKGNAHSAGSSIRRYNETALTAEIRELMESWKDMLKTSELIFIRASGSQNRRTLFGYDEAIFKPNDPRIRKFPFSTRRATQKELMRSFAELTRFKVSHIDDAALAAAAETATPAIAAAKVATLARPKISKEEEQELAHTAALTTALRRSKAPAIINYLKTHSLFTDYRLHPPNHHTPTLLHLAAASGNPAVVLSLLTKPNPPADPTLLNTDGKTAFELAADRPTRDVFRVARSELGDGRWDWSAAKVPEGITRKQADESLERERLEADKEERDRREKELQRLKSLPDTPRNDPPVTKASLLAAKPARTAGGVASGSSRRDDTRGLSEDAIRRLEREKRARAAEERMKAMAKK